MLGITHSEDTPENRRCFWLAGYEFSDDFVGYNFADFLNVLRKAGAEQGLTVLFQTIIRSGKYGHSLFLDDNDNPGKEGGDFECHRKVRKVDRK